jgi:hypothetical protein
MKKILFIMILATTFIPMPQTGASLGDMNESNIYKTKEAQTMVTQESNYALENEAQFTPEKI